MERFINILVLDNKEENIADLKRILSGNGNNLVFVESPEDVYHELRRREFGIMIINIDDEAFGGLAFIKQLAKEKLGIDSYKIITSSRDVNGYQFVKGLKQGAIDYIHTPYKRSLTRAKVGVLKKLYFKDLRINQLLSNILPENVLNDLNTYGKFSPRRIDDGTVLFTDFVGFTKISKDMLPLELVKQLETYFTKFDEIVERYKLEKIKTIGDAYMALAGVTEDNQHPAIRASLAAIEMRDFINTRIAISKAMNEPYWEMRVGIHSGPLVAGIIGTKKTSFDVWGDTVNIAARAEQHAEPNTINITKVIAEKICDYFNLTHRGEIPMKYGGSLDMYTLESIKKEYSLYGEGKIACSAVRKKADLMEMDFEHARKDILNKLKTSLPEELIYHDIKHTLNVEKSAIRIAKLEGLVGEDLIILRTAALFHDAGFILRYNNNEDIAIQLLQSMLPNYGYNDEHITKISNIVKSTKYTVQPNTLLEKIMCDADHDYLGRPDYTTIANRLRKELHEKGTIMSDKEWIEFQLDYLINTHRYYTNTSINIRLGGKKERIKALKKQLKEIQVSKIKTSK